MQIFLLLLFFHFKSVTAGLKMSPTLKRFNQEASKEKPLMDLSRYTCAGGFRVPHISWVCCISGAWLDSSCEVTKMISHIRVHTYVILRSESTNIPEEATISTSHFWVEGNLKLALHCLHFQQPLLEAETYRTIHTNSPSWVTLSRQ